MVLAEPTSDIGMGEESYSKRPMVLLLLIYLSVGVAAAGIWPLVDSGRVP